MQGLLSRYWREDPGLTTLYVYAAIITVAAYANRARRESCFWGEVNGADPGQQGSCYCGVDKYCLCTPAIAVDSILEVRGVKGELKGFAFVKRKDGLGIALPGGFVELGETFEEAIMREIREEVGVSPQHLRLHGAYSRPDRDARRNRHAVSIVYVGQVGDGLKAGDDANDIVIVPPSDLDKQQIFAFDHGEIIAEYLNERDWPRRTSKRRGADTCRVKT